jgi:nitroimidazol reductase NimA-like FMN-containing flavoprotein (pyridoxamine 5'-phosphate oxidase superfamily)
MNTDPVPRPLAAAECLRLLRSAPMGRIVYSDNALPAVEPVRFTLHGGQIFAAISQGSFLSAAIDQSIVAFQADQFGEGRDQCYWAVTVIGHAQTLSDPARINKLRANGLSSWTPGGCDQFLHIKPGIVTGKRWLG